MARFKKHSTYRRRWQQNLARGCAVTAVGALVAACGSSASSSSSGTSAASSAKLQSSWISSTPAAVGAKSTVDWDLFYEPSSIDPIHALDYAEDEVVSNLCDTVVKMNPDGSYTAGITTFKNPNPTTWVYTVRSGAKFWDGEPVTAADVAYSLNRNLSTADGSYYADFFDEVQSIKQTGPNQVTAKLKKPDSLFNEALALTAGSVTEEKYDIAKGKTLGTPSGGIMCSGPYKLVKWVPGQSLTIVANPDYWNKAVKPKVDKVVFSFITGDSAETNALTTGEVQGMYDTPVSGTSSLESSSGHLYLGKSLTQLVLNPVSTLTSNPMLNADVRRALSLAVDRAQVAKTMFDGIAQVPTSNTLFAEPIYPYGAGVFAAAEKTFPDLGVVNLKQAKADVKASGESGKPITLAYESNGPSYDGEFAEYLQSVGQSIGLDIKLDPLPAATFNNIGFDTSLDNSVDAQVEGWFNELPDPIQWYVMFSHPAGSEWDTYNYSHYTSPVVTDNLELARETANPTKRAQYVVKAMRQVMIDVPWIPVVDIPTRLYMSAGLTGPTVGYTYMWSPWAASLGTTK